MVFFTVSKFVFSLLVLRRFSRTLLCLSGTVLLSLTCLWWQSERAHAYGRMVNERSYGTGTQPPQAKQKYLISPPKMELGKEYEVIIYAADCNNDINLGQAKVIAPQGSGIVILGPADAKKCAITAKLRIESDAALGKHDLWLKGLPNDETGMVEVEKTAISPGPIPPGLDPQVDLMWGVMEKKVVHDNFGRDIANDFYGIQLVIGNNSGYDLQIAGVGFRLPNQALQKRGVVFPTNSYRATRGVLEREQEFGRRSIILNSLKATGGLFTGFLPFWRMARPRANAATWADIVNGPLVAGFELIVPDTTVKQLVRLDDQMLRDGLIVKNNSQIRTLVFIPKALLNLSKTTPSPTPTPTPTPTQGTFVRYPLKNKDLSIDPQFVMEQLGDLVLVGQQISYLNRVQVISRPDGAVTPPPMITGVSEELTQGDSRKSVAFTGTNLLGAVITAPDKFTVANDPVKANSATNSLIVEISVDETVMPGEYPFVIATKAGAWIKMMKVKPTAPVVKTEYEKPKANKDEEQTLILKLTGKGLTTSKLVIPFAEPTAKYFSIKSGPTPVEKGIQYTLTVAKKAEAKKYKLEVDNHGEKATFEIEVVP